VHQPTAQLTLFYAGLVHVYDDITLDKMQAIMLLASGSTTSSSCKDPSGNGVSAHPLSSPIPQSTPSSSVSPPPQATTTATAAPSSIHANILPRSIARSVHAGKCPMSTPKGRLLQEVGLECLQLTFYTTVLLSA
jgi:hypothetical protein